MKVKSPRLPRWSQMLVTGDPVTVDQAQEIIRRTDRFLVEGRGGNDEERDKALARRLRMPHYFLSKHTQDEWSHAYWEERNRSTRLWREAWGAIHTQFVVNSWISSACASGPDGWCRPDGTVSYVHNVGRRPSVGGVLQDWTDIATAFPFLRLAATLMDKEYCESPRTPVITILVASGSAELADGSIDHHASFPPPPPESTWDDDVVMDLTGWAHEHGPIPTSWYEEWEKRARSMRIEE